MSSRLEQEIAAQGAVLARRAAEGASGAAAAANLLRGAAHELVVRAPIQKPTRRAVAPDRNPVRVAPS